MRPRTTTAARAPMPTWHAPGSVVQSSEPVRLHVTAIPDEQDELALLDRIVERRRALQVLLVTCSADDECEHGRCPGDRSDACGCFEGREIPHHGKNLVVPQVLAAA